MPNQRPVHKSQLSVSRCTHMAFVRLLGRLGCARLCLGWVTFTTVKDILHYICQCRVCLTHYCTKGPLLPLLAGRNGSFKQVYA